MGKKVDLKKIRISKLSNVEKDLIVGGSRIEVAGGTEEFSLKFPCEIEFSNNALGTC